MFLRHETTRHFSFLCVLGLKFTKTNEPRTHKPANFVWPFCFLLKFLFLFLTKRKKKKRDVFSVCFHGEKTWWMLGQGFGFFLSSSFSFKRLEEKKKKWRERREKKGQRERERCYRDPVAKPNMPSPVTWHSFYTRAGGGDDGGGGGGGEGPNGVVEKEGGMLQHIERARAPHSNHGLLGSALRVSLLRVLIHTATRIPSITASSPSSPEVSTWANLFYLKKKENEKKKKTPNLTLRHLYNANPLLASFWGLFPTCISVFFSFPTAIVAHCMFYV
jgi:hypothetical protein